MNARGLMLSVFATTLGVLACTSAPALAAPPEVPQLEVTSHTATSATLRGVLNPGAEGEAGTYEFLYRRSPSECEGESVSAGGLSFGVQGEVVSQELSGLEPGTVYAVCLLARNEAGETAVGPIETFTTSAVAPSIAEESTSNVSSTAATLVAGIDPGGAATTYRFEYGTSEAYGTSIPVPDGEVGAGTSAQAVQAHPQGLQPDTTYHFRVVATNAHGTVDGANQSFTTQTTGGELALPDGRAWELVSPPDKQGSGLESLTNEGGIIQAAGDGGAMAYVANGPTEAEPAANNAPEVQQVLARRGPDGWDSKDIAIPRDAVAELGVGHLSEYQLFSTDLSVGLVEPESATPLSPAASEKTVYLRDDASGAYLPLVTAANVPPGVKFGTEDFTEDVHFADATPDLSHVVLETAAGLTPNVDSGEQSLYEWAGGQLQLISVLPDGTPAANESERSDLGDNDNNVRNAISDDGTRVVWEAAHQTVEHHLYMRDMETEETVQLDAFQGGSAKEIQEPEFAFQAASVDGSRVFFTDTATLTADSTATSASPDLYVCAMVEVAGRLACRLTDLTVDKHAGESADVQDLVLGASEDGSYVYFVANGALAPGASSGDCNGSSLSPGATCNLYVEHYDSERAQWEEPTFIATLSQEDEPDWGIAGGGDAQDLTLVTSRVSPDGRYLAFMSDRSLTGYNNVDVSPEAHGARDEEAYLYDAESKHLVCVSCDPTGARPAGVFDPKEYPGLLIDHAGIWHGRWLAGSIPGWTALDLHHAIYQSRYLLDSGLLFFDSADALVAQDTNGVEDVYEYEPRGVGSCESAGGAFSERSGGCVGLISSGSSGEESAFLDASESGDDAFFLTAAPLVSQDVDTAFDVYDAHVCGAAVPCPVGVVSSPPCTTADSCRAAPLPQPAVYGAPSSATFSGSGNLAPAVTKPAVKPKKPKRKARSKGKSKRKRKRKASVGKRRRVGKSTVKKSLSLRARR